MSSTVVHVKNISSETSEKEVRDFFSFCGKITNLSVTPESDAADSTKSATVTFEKESAAKTALLLDSTQLGPTQVSVSSAANLDDLAASAGQTTTSGGDDGDISQEDKPRARIVAEYLAQGYALSDATIQKAIALDNKHGVSNRFTNALAQFDAKYHATDKAKGIDASYGITDKVTSGWKGLSSYFEKALETPTGQKLASFYTMSEKQVLDVHAEARRLADLKSGKSSSGSGSGSGTSKSAGDTSSDPSAVPGTDKTQCQCGGDAGVCKCEDGKCACSGCEKSRVAGHGHTATGPADTVAASTSMPPLDSKS
jgi:hypothetical protein